MDQNENEKPKVSDKLGLLSKLKDCGLLNFLSKESLSNITHAEIKNAYREAAKVYHPDKNKDGLEIMKKINAVWDTIKDCSFPICLENDFRENELNAVLAAALSKIIHLDGISVELCGSWLWIGGNTLPHKKTLKDAKYLWSRKKGKWYFRQASSKSTYRKKGRYTMDQIRAAHGSSKYSQRKVGQLSA